MALKRNRGEIPSDLGTLIDTLDNYGDRLDTLERFSGTQRAGTTSDLGRTLAYLASLITAANNGAASLSTGTVPNDGVIRWFATTPDTTVTLDCPTGKMLVTASVGEASVTPGGHFVQALVTYSVRDALGVLVPGATIGANSGRTYTNIRKGDGLTTNQQLVTVLDGAAQPGPYKVRAFLGFWAATLNTTACSATFNDPSLVVQVIGDGVE